MGDRGLQCERTQLAWTRTALVAAGCVLVLLRISWEAGSALFMGAAVLLTFAAVLACSAYGMDRCCPKVDSSTGRHAILKWVTALQCLSCLLVLIEMLRSVMTGLDP